MCNESRTSGIRRGLYLGFLLLLVSFLAISVDAQIHGVPASVTSLDNSNHTLANPPGVPASVTSLGPQGFTPGRGCCFNFKTNGNRPFFTGRHHRDRDNGFVGAAAIPYPVYVPYYYPTDMANAPEDAADEGSPAGPTIFDRHSGNPPGSAYESRLDERLDRLEQKLDEAESSNEQADNKAATPLRTAPDQPPTILVYRDGHTVEVKNYAIIGDTLYDYSTGSRRKIALSDLDLAATQKQNDDRGIDFRVPGHPSGN